MDSRAEVIRMLSELARLTALDEGSPQAFRVRAYERAIAGIESYPGDISELSKKELVEIPGVGESIAEKILEFERTGTVRRLEELRKKYPPAFVELTRIPGLGPKTLKRMRAELGVEDLESLQKALDAHRLQELPGLGAKSEERMRRAIERLGLHGKDRRTPLADALPLAQMLAERLAALKGVDAVVPCGSIRRFVETVGDIDIVVSSTDADAVRQAVLGFPELTEVVGSGETKTSFLTREGMQVDVRTVQPHQLGSALLYFTGSKVHNIRLRQLAIDRGWLLSEYGLFHGEEVIASKTEKEIYQALDLEFIAPPLREGSGEIEAAAEGRLPRLIERRHILGDLHYHSTRSGDGRSSPEKMVEAAIAAGYEYVAFTEHGENLAINGSTREEMLAHRRRLRRLDDRYPELKILFGCELNIGPEGELDYDGEFRLEFDYCVASIHSHFDLPAERQTVRILRALEDPAVNAIGHLSGRYIGRRPGAELDIDAVIEGLVATGVALEINGALQRLDATAEVARQAIAAGVDVVIDTDAHHVSELVRMDYGVTYAQRGWVPVERVLNARGVDAVLEKVASRRP
ncbi:MAG: DNA polymerase/3'-5' exonuclease PolX [Acidimicrobiia bacterium]